LISKKIIHLIPDVSLLNKTRLLSGFIYLAEEVGFSLLAWTAAFHRASALLSFALLTLTPGGKLPFPTPSPFEFRISGSI